jgi:hypothetical protein
LSRCRWPSWQILWSSPFSALIWDTLTILFAKRNACRKFTFWWACEQINKMSSTSAMYSSQSKSSVSPLSSPKD